MKVETTVDVGQNLTSLLERLAQQIGTTADKVFPWYVEQAHLHGVTTLAALAIALVLFGTIFALAIRKAEIGNDNPNVAFFISLVSGIAMALSVVFAFIDGPDAVRRILNPQFYAMQALAQDIGRMTGK